MKKNKNNHGFFLLEVIIASAIIGTSLVFILGSLGTTLTLAKKGLEETQSAYLLEEGGEAIKIIRNQTWANISSLTLVTDTEEAQAETGVQTAHAYYLSWANGASAGLPGSWTLSNSNQKIGNFTRTIVFQAVYRDTNKKIVTTGGTLDTGTIKAVVTVSWSTLSGLETESLPMYITNI